MSKVPLTARGAEQLRDELKRLKSDERPRVVQAIAEAREHGDLKENAEYHAAKEHQGLIEARIRDIEGKLSNSQVIDVTQLPPSDRVVFGATIDLFDVESGRETRYQIVGEDESDIKGGLLSIQSPIARAIIGKEAGDSVEVATPGGQHAYEIAAVEYI